MNKFNMNIPLYKPFIHQPIIHQPPKFQSNELYNKFEENQKQFQKFLTKPLFTSYKPIDKSKTYEQKCIYCSSSKVIMSDILELQRCHDCNKEYVPKVLELR